MSNYSDAFDKSFPVCIDGQVVVGEQYFAEFRRAVAKQNKLVGITTRGFLSRREHLCMIVYMSPLRYNFTFPLYSPTILLEKLSSYKCLFLSSRSEVNQHLASYKISNLTSSINYKLGDI